MTQPDRPLNDAYVSGHFIYGEDFVNYIVLDLEWNQAADTKTKEENKLLFEIIEIGAVKLNEKKKQISSFHELIRPQVFRRMHQVTGELIHIKIEELTSCRTFAEVVKDFLAWCGEDYIFCTWGNLDLLELQRNMDYYGLPPLTDKPLIYYDVQKLFSIAYEDRKLRRTLAYAVDYLEIKKDIAFHRADSDAYYTAKVLQHFYHPAIFHNYSFDTYRLPKTRADEVHAVFDDYEKYISRAFPDKTTALQDKEVSSARCFLCGANTKKKIPWFSMNGKHYYTIVVCEKHGLLKGKIRMRKSADDKIYVVKTMKQVNEETVKELMNRRKQRKNKNV